MRFFQQRRTQRENQFNHKIDEKQKLLAELHSSPEYATGHAVVVFQLQEERNRFVSLFKSKKLEASKSKRRMNLLNKVFGAASMPPLSLRQSRGERLSPILEESSPRTESSRPSAGRRHRGGFSEGSPAPPAASSPPPSPPASASEPASATTTAAAGSEERAIDLPVLEPLLDVRNPALEWIEHAAHETVHRSSIVAHEVAHAAVEVEHAVEHAVEHVAYLAIAAIAGSTWLGLGLDLNRNPNPNPNPSHVAIAAIAGSTWLGLGLDLNRNPNPNPNPSHVAIAAIAGSRPPLSAAGFKPVRVHAAPEPSDIEWENMHVKQVGSGFGLGLGLGSGLATGSGRTCTSSMPPAADPNSSPDPHPKTKPNPSPSPNRNPDPDLLT
jgi:hypothetical protein